jgi:hypothetical protein
MENATNQEPAPPSAVMQERKRQRGFLFSLRKVN